MSKEMQCPICKEYRNIKFFIKGKILYKHCSICREKHAKDEARTKKYRLTRKLNNMGIGFNLSDSIPGITTYKKIKDPLKIKEIKE